MIIKSLEIISFGKFKDKTINLDSGLNVILGDNESGKSTIMSFIYAMLYGFGDNRGKSASLREKYTPWDGGVCEGKLTLNLTNGEDITIYRKAGSVKKQDTLRVYNPLTGQELSSMPEEIIGIGSDTFSKTLCLKQLSTAFNGTNEEIVQKLSNISAGGDENVSFEKAIKILENARREIKPLRGSGGTLSQINAQIADLEKKRAIYLSKLSELEDAQKVLPRMQKSVDEVKANYENELSQDFISPIAHLQGRIEEKEAQRNISSQKTSISRKKIYILGGILSAILSVTFLPFLLLFIIASA
ncbi:MAG: AAA family ATPase, partial [Clostridia bacterium]|nr:AAA family ATPase [Clostridia bacterium]